jgi:hypothetical protein
VSALQAYPRYPALMSTLEANGVRTVATYAAAARAAAALGGDDQALGMFQAGLAVVDRARLAGTIDRQEAGRLIAALIDVAMSRTIRVSLIGWWKNNLMPSLRRAAIPNAQDLPTESLVLAAMAGPPPVQPPLVTWEGQTYHVDVVQPELQRLTRIRNSEDEVPLDTALEAATTRDMKALAFSLQGIVYAGALAEADAQAVAGGPVWRRHRFSSSSAAGQSETGGAWRIATEVFGSGDWHLSGSILRLDVALAHLGLQRLDITEIPAGSQMSTKDRQTLAISVALIDPLAVTDAQRDEVAAAIRRGRERVAALAREPERFDAIARDAALSEWRQTAVRWLIANDNGRVGAAFTILELFRLGRTAEEPVPAGWGAASSAQDGCLCLRMPSHDAWEEYIGRASTGQLATQLADVMLRGAELLAARGLPARLIRAVTAFAMQQVIDTAAPAYFDDWLSVAFAARDLSDDRFDDIVAALTASGPLVK